MKFTVLGNTGPYPKAGGACSGYLFEYNNKKVLLDCGNGVLSNLLKICKLDELDAIILSHLHPDHISDIFILRYALKYKGLSIPLYAPNSPYDKFKELEYENVFDIRIIDNNYTFVVDDIKFTFKEMKHAIRSFAISIEANKKFVYSGDTKYTTDLVEFAKEADLFLCEAGVLNKDLINNPPHLSAEQAVGIANDAKVQRLVLTHFFPQYKKEEYMNEVDDIFNGIFECAEIMKTYYL